MFEHSHSHKCFKRQSEAIKHMESPCRLSYYSGSLEGNRFTSCERKTDNKFQLDVGTVI